MMVDHVVGTVPAWKAVRVGERRPAPKVGAAVTFTEDGAPWKLTPVKMFTGVGVGPKESVAVPQRMG